MTFCKKRSKKTQFVYFSDVWPLNSDNESSPGGSSMKRCHSTSDFDNSHGHSNNKNGSNANNVLADITMCPSSECGRMIAQPARRANRHSNRRDSLKENNTTAAAAASVAVVPAGAEDGGKKVNIRADLERLKSLCFIVPIL